MSYPKISQTLVDIGYIEVGDLPVVNGVLDYRSVQMQVQEAGFATNIFLQCTALQKIFGSRLGEDKSSRTFPLELDCQVKKLLQQQRQTFVSMAKWEISIGESILWDESLLSFNHLLKQCKLTKFREFNFKMLHRILATPVVISMIWKVVSIALCSWCGSRTDIDHILLTYPNTLALYT